MRLFLATLAAIFLFSPAHGVSAETPKGFVSIGKERLEGLRLIIKEAGCSLAAPNTDWVWVAPENMLETSYMCLSQRSGAGITVSVGQMAGDMDEHTQKELTAGCRQSAEKSGAVVSNEKFEASEIPFPKKSWRYSYTATAGTRKVVAIFYFIRAAGKAFVTIQGVSLDGADTPTFRNFIASMQLLPATAPPVPKK